MLPRRVCRTAAAAGHAAFSEALGPGGGCVFRIAGRLYLAFMSPIVYKYPRPSTLRLDTLPSRLLSSQTSTFICSFDRVFRIKTEESAARHLEQASPEDPLPSPSSIEIVAFTTTQSRCLFPPTSSGVSPRLRMSSLHLSTLSVFPRLPLFCTFSPRTEVPPPAITPPCIPASQFTPPPTSWAVCPFSDASTADGRRPPFSTCFQLIIHPGIPPLPSSSIFPTACFMHRVPVEAGLSGHCPSYNPASDAPRSAPRLGRLT
jgi:hypothetical protein